MKVIFHIDDLGRWFITKGNVKNLLDIDDSVEVVVVVNGPAIKGYLDDSHADFIARKDVEFHACKNAMNSNDIKESDLPENVKVVPAGVYDIVQLQDQGYGYIKP